MAPQNKTEALETKLPATSETLKVGAIPETFEVPEKNERFLIGVEAATEQGEDPKGGFEVVSLADCARDESGIITYEYSTKDDEGNTRTESVKLNGNTVALLVKNGKTPDFATGKGFKGLREGELVTDQVISKRFGETTNSFCVGITEGKIIVENTRPEAELRVTTTKETAAETAIETPGPVVELEVSAERSEIASELGEDALDLVGVNEPNDEIDAETKPRPSIAEMMGAEAPDALEVVDQVVAEAPAVEAAIETPEVVEQVVTEGVEDASIATSPELVITEPTPEVPSVESELGTAEQESVVFEAKMGETKAALEQLIGDQYDSFKDINKGLDELFEDKTGQEADLPSLLHGNVAKLSTYIREIDAGHGDVNTLQAIASILGSVQGATNHLQGGNSPFVKLADLIEVSQAKAQVLGEEGVGDAAQGMSQAVGRMTEAVNRDETAAGDRAQYDAAINKSRYDVISLINDVEDNDGPIVGSRRIAATISNDLGTARLQYFTMNGFVDSVLSQISTRVVNTNDLHEITRMMRQFENTFEQIGQSKRGLASFIPQTTEQ